MYKFPSISKVIPVGLFNWASVAKILSPLKPAIPVPANVEIVPS